MTAAAKPPSPRTRVRRMPKRGHYDRAPLDAILDAGFVCHVGYVIDGVPCVTPTLYWREADRFIDSLYPGRSSVIRPPTRQELKATTLLSMAIDEASAKIRTGPPIDFEADYGLGVWAGVIPLRPVAGPPIPEARLTAGAALPGHVTAFRRRCR